MSNATITTECVICTSIIDISPSIDPKRYDKLQDGEGVFFVCGLCKHQIAQVLKCPKSHGLTIIDFTEKGTHYEPNMCGFCGKVEVYSTVELLPMFKIDRGYL